ncbi:MAG: hypothetical protein GY838_13270 [bacterium]|nr:hypothetical protein [bacterium]
MTRAEAERLLEAIETTSDALIAELDGSPSATVQAQRVGMTVLKEHLMKALDFRGYASDESQVDTTELRGLVGRYCRQHCPSSRTSTPGTASACSRCPLQCISIEPTLRQAARAKETDPHA